MKTTLIILVIAIAGFVASRSRFVHELNSRRFMPVLYAAGTAYFGVRTYAAIAGEARVWPSALLGAISLAGAIDSARASGIFRRP
jgi:hypothetical protein